MEKPEVLRLRLPFYAQGFLTLVLICSPSGLAQDLQLEEGAVGTYLRLKELQTIGSVLHIVAHPDDEDGAMLAYCARGLGARTMLFSITRGEGGANLISSHFFDELGALRTLEHQKAASYYGNQLFYSRAADYGYSKSLEEAMKQWQNGLPILEDLVEVIRRERPTVMLSRFRGDPRDGHGHHQMAGVVSRLSFEAAADPTKFPKQIQLGLEPWQVKKLYVRAGSPWRQPEDGEWTIAIPTGTFDPIIGRSYAQIARFGLGFQRSQGISGHDGDPGIRYSYYRLEKQAGGAAPANREESVFDGLDTSLGALVEDPATPMLQDAQRQLDSIGRRLAFLMRDWDPVQPKQTVKALANSLAALRSLEILRDENKASRPSRLEEDLRRLDRKIQDAIIIPSGLRVDAWATDLTGEDINHATPLEPIQIHVRIANQSEASSAKLMSLSVEMPAGATQFDVEQADEIAPGEVFENKLQVDLVRLEPTKPHWNRHSMAEPLYEVNPDGKQRPSPRSPLVAKASLRLADELIDLESIVRVRQRHPEYGRVTFPLMIAPAMSVRFPLDSGLIMRGKDQYTLPVIVQSCVGGPANATVRLVLPQGWSSKPTESEIAFEREDEVVTVEFKLLLPQDTSPIAHEIRAVVTYRGRDYDEGFETVSARQVGRMNIYHDASHQVQVANVKMLGMPAVAYVTGSGDQVAESLAPLGVSPAILSESDLASGNLSRFDVILVGVRAYAVREDIRKYNARLLEFVKNGGVLVVQYQTPEFDQNFGPYPYEMGRRPEEVSEEDAQVTILAPGHPVFTTPNQINSADFENWFEQRGSKFWSTWNEKYTPLLECHDTGQAPQRGGMLVARYGKGIYIYSAYSWYRQLPNGVSGAYRLFANMLSLPETDVVK